MIRALRPVLVLLACLLTAALPATAGAATTYPSVSKVSPLKVGIGDVLTLSGKGFRKGKNKNIVVFKRDGGRAVFLKADSATSTKITMIVPAKLLPFLKQKEGQAQFTRFRLRVLAARFGKRYTAVKKSPLVGPTAVGVGNANDCDGDKVVNANDSDDDNDLLLDAEEAALGTQSCNRDSDGDGMSDGWEQFSAIDRNNKAVPSPSRRPYPNALDAKDGSGMHVDHDGDGLTNMEEYVAWATHSGRLAPPDSDPYTSRLSYSGGNPNSAGRPKATPEQWYMDRDGNGYLSDFERDADGDNIPNLDEMRTETDAARGPGEDSMDVPAFHDVGLFGALYLEKYAVERSKQDFPRCAGINQVPYYCLESYSGSELHVAKVEQLDWVESDTDGDGVRDDNDDVDHDDIANLPEYLAELGSASGDRQFRHLDACVPNTDSRFCLVGTVDVDRDGLENRDDSDDDGDLLADDLEKSIKTDPLRADTDADGVTDGFEYYSALDLNSLALPYPGKRPYPNALDKDDAHLDFDQDSLTLTEEYKAWRYTGSPLPLSYSDGTQWTDGEDRDDFKDVDNDGLDNFTESHGPLSSPKWWDEWILQDENKCHPQYIESTYPGPAYLGTNFVDPDTDGDGLKDGADDIDHDGFTNAEESYRAGDWCQSYISTVHTSGWDRYARVQPFNPCKPVYSDYCHANPPLGYYPSAEDWRSPYFE